MRAGTALLGLVVAAACQITRLAPRELPTAAAETRRSSYPDREAKRTELRVLVWSDGRALSPPHVDTGALPGIHAGVDHGYRQR